MHLMMSGKEKERFVLRSRLLYGKCTTRSQKTAIIDDLLLRQLKNIAWTQRQIGICRAESPRNFEPVRGDISIASGGARHASAWRA